MAPPAAGSNFEAALQRMRPPPVHYNPTKPDNVPPGLVNQLQVQQSVIQQYERQDREQKKEREEHQGLVARLKQSHQTEERLRRERNDALSREADMKQHTGWARAEKLEATIDQLRSQITGEGSFLHMETGHKTIPELVADFKGMEQNSSLQQQTIAASAEKLSDWRKFFRELRDITERSSCSEIVEAVREAFKSQSDRLGDGNQQMVSDVGMEDAIVGQIQAQQVQFQDALVKKEDEVRAACLRDHEEKMREQLAKYETLRQNDLAVQAQQDHSDCMRNYAQLEGLYKAVVQDHSHCQAKYDNVNQLKLKAEQQAQDAESRNRSVLSDHAAANSAQKKTEDELKQEKKNCDQRIEKLQSICNDGEQQIINLESKLGASELKVSVLVRERDDAQNERKTAKEEIMGLENKIKELDGMVDRLSNVEAQHNSLLSQVSNAVKKTESEEYFSQEGREMIDYVEQSANILLQLRNDNFRLSNDLTLLTPEGQIQQESEELQRRDATIASQEETIVSLDTTIISRDATITSLDREVARLKRHVSFWTSRNDATIKQIERLTSEASSFKSYMCGRSSSDYIKSVVQKCERSFLREEKKAREIVEKAKEGFEEIIQRKFD